MSTRKFEVDVRIEEVLYATIEVEVDDTPFARQNARDAAIQRYWDEGDEALRHTEIGGTDIEVPNFEGREVTEL
jgi:hypothetical protein